MDGIVFSSSPKYYLIEMDKRERAVFKYLPLIIEALLVLNQPCYLVDLFI